MNPLLNLFYKREVFWQFLLRNVKSRHRGSILGSLWLLINPLLMLALYVFAFGVIFGGRFTDSADESTLDYALGVFLGLGVLGMISGIISSAPGVILSQPNFVKKVVFPLEVLPAAVVGALGYDFLIGFVLCIFGVQVFGPGLSPTLLYVFIIIPPVFIASLGIAWFFSAIGVFIRDIGQLGSFFGLALLYASGVFYSAEKAKVVAPAIWTFLKWNPLIHLIDSLRKVVLWNLEPNWHLVGYSWIISILILLLGAWVFNRLRPAFADVL